MTRAINHEGEFTAFGRWINRRCRDSRDGLSVTNLDYVIEDFNRKRMMLLEEKTRGGVLHPAQRMTFKVLDRMLRAGSETDGYAYWGFYLLVLPPLAETPCEGMTLNGKAITEDQLIAHMNFDERFCDPLDLADPDYTNPAIDEWFSPVPTKGGA